MKEELLIELIEEEKLTALELIDVLYFKDKYNLTNFQLNDVQEQINNKIEESVNKVELIKIKEKLTEYNMDTSQVDKMIKRLEPIKDEDIESFDFEEIEYYIYDGFDMLTQKQQFLLYKKAKKMKFHNDELDYIIEQINDSKYVLEENNTQEQNNQEDSKDLFDALLMSNIFKNKKEIKNIKKQNDYESYQFEEEELEEDDYYYEDPD